MVWGSFPVFHKYKLALVQVKCVFTFFAVTDYEILKMEQPILWFQQDMPGWPDS